VKPRWTIDTHFKKNKGQEGKTGLVQHDNGGRKKGIRMNEGEYGGCILYSYKKIE
jgi:hypothetical protein